MYLWAVQNLFHSPSSHPRTFIWVAWWKTNKHDALFFNHRLQVNPGACGISMFPLFAITAPHPRCQWSLQHLASMACPSRPLFPGGRGCSSEEVLWRSRKSSTCTSPDKLLHHEPLCHIARTSNWEQKWSLDWDLGIRRDSTMYKSQKTI